MYWICTTYAQYTPPTPTRRNCRVVTRRRRRCEQNSQLAHDDCQRIRRCERSSIGRDPVYNSAANAIEVGYDVTHMTLHVCKHSNQLCSVIFVNFYNFFSNDVITSSLVSTGNCKLGHGCQRMCSHRRHDATRQFRRVGVGGVYWALVLILHETKSRLLFPVMIMLNNAKVFPFCYCFAWIVLLIFQVFKIYFIIVNPNCFTERFLVISNHNWSECRPRRTCCVMVLDSSRAVASISCSRHRRRSSDYVERGRGWRAVRVLKDATTGRSVNAGQRCVDSCPARNGSHQG